MGHHRINAGLDLWMADEADRLKLTTGNTKQHIHHPPRNLPQPPQLNLPSREDVL